MELRRLLQTSPILVGAVVLMLGLAAVAPPPRSNAIESGFDGTGAFLEDRLTASQAARELIGLPALEPLELAPVGPDKARLINAGIPFASSLGAFAKPFAWGGDDASRERAVDCLASAMWYEAGNDPRGQRAVAQVVLNRVRHPAFPASVCGVVFQGSERSTGCQFTFTCDGALRRVPSPVAFARARAEARAMLDGAVDWEVGLATHYHTDWVHPTWSAALDKLARVDTHLFFRWRGKWGSASGMMQRHSGTEPAVGRLAGLSPIHRMALSPTEVALAALPADGSSTNVEIGLGLPRDVTPASSARSAGQFDLAVAPSASGGAPAMAALDLCGERGFCKVVGKLTADASRTQSGPGPGEVVFLYVRDRRTGVDRAFWDCATFQRNNLDQCLVGENRAWLNFNGNFSGGGKQAPAA